MFLGPILLNKGNVVRNKSMRGVFLARKVSSSKFSSSGSNEGYPGATFGGSTPQNRIATLTLEDGTILQGVSFGAEKAVAGEVVFNTGMDFRNLILKIIYIYIL